MDREALAALDPFQKTMLLSTLYWPDEVRDMGELDLPDEQFEFKPAEKQMARQLVQAMTGEFDPSQYKDEYREALMQVIEAKIEGEPVEIAAPEPEPAKLTDLMAVLEASVAAARQGRATASSGSSKAEPEQEEPAAKRAAGGRSRSRAASEPTPVSEAPSARGGKARGRAAGKEAREEAPAAAKSERRRKSA
jgi:DNA end-binding protein Ku